MVKKIKKKIFYGLCVIFYLVSFTSFSFEKNKEDKKSYLDTFNGKIQCVNNIAISGTNFSCSAVSISPNDTSKVIYSISINPISVANLNLTGYNGFSYELSITDSSGNTTTKYSYPLSGMNASNGQNFILRAVSFEFEGPLYNGTGTQPTITLQCNAFDLNKGKYASSYKKVLQHSKFEDGVHLSAPTVTLLTETQGLPQYTSTSQNFDNYTIEVLTTHKDNSLWNYDVGTCAVPFDVIIYDPNGVEVTDPKIYNRLVFTYQINPNIKSYEVIEGDPCNDDNGCAILPATSVEIPTESNSLTSFKNIKTQINKHVKYGIDGEQMVNVKGGALYYLFCHGDIVDGQNIHIGLVNDSGSFSLKGTKDVLVKIFSPDFSNLSYNEYAAPGQTINLYAQISLFPTDSIAVPNLIEGNIMFLVSNEYAMFESSSSPGLVLPNYCLDDYCNDSPAIYYVPNEVISQQTLRQRYNWNNLATGFNIEAINSQGEPQDNPLNTDTYEWQKATYNSFLTRLVNMVDLTSETNDCQSLNDYLFSQFGTVHAYTPAQDGDEYDGGNYRLGKIPFTLPDGFKSAPMYVVSNLSAFDATTFAYGLPNSHYGLFIGNSNDVTILYEVGCNAPLDKNLDLNVVYGIFWDDMQSSSLRKSTNGVKDVFK